MRDRLPPAALGSTETDWAPYSRAVFVCEPLTDGVAVCVVERARESVHRGSKMGSTKASQCSIFPTFL